MYLHNQPGLGENRKLVHRRPPASSGQIRSGMAGFSEPRSPIMDIQCPNPPGCPPVEAARCRAAVREAVTGAIRLATNAVNKIQAAISVPPGDRNAEARQTANFFRFFFGHDPTHPIPWAGNQASAVSVIARFRAVANELSGGRRVIFQCRPTRVGCGEDLTCCDPNDNAWFHVGVPNTVNLCAGFWNPPADLRGLPHRTFRAAIIMHEMLHMLFEDIRDARQGRPRAACYEAFALRAAGFGADPVDVCLCRGTPCPA
jgi:hypothetical protein